MPAKAYTAFEFSLSYFYRFFILSLCIAEFFIFRKSPRTDSAIRRRIAFTGSADQSVLFDSDIERPPDRICICYSAWGQHIVMLHFADEWLIHACGIPGRCRSVYFQSSVFSGSPKNRICSRWVKSSGMVKPRKISLIRSAHR